MSENPRFGIRGVPPLATVAAAAAVALTLVIAVFILLGQSGPPGGTATPNPAAGQGGCAPEEGEEEVATLQISGALTFVCTLDGIAGDVSPTDTLIAAVWTESVDDPGLQYADIVTVILSGPVFNGTQATADPGIIVSFSWWRMGPPNASGEPVDIFDHDFSSRDGECSVTMQGDADAISGSFECPAITDGDGHTVKATGTFRI